MEFARRQLEKYGWSDGKGLGRREDGIPRPLRAQLKRSAAGVGHDPAAEHNDHWWSALYDAAAANVEVKSRSGKTKEITTKDPGAVVISDKSWRVRRGPRGGPTGGGYMEHFVKTAVLTSGGAKTERLASAESESEEESGAGGPRITDEELFAACGGRTAHKGARHGLRAMGKLARIEEQEKSLLKQTRYEGYSHAKVEPAAEDCPREDTEEKTVEKKGKKKRKKNKNNEDISEDMVFENVGASLKDPELDVLAENANNAGEEDSLRDKKKNKKGKNNKETLVGEEEKAASQDTMRDAGEEDDRSDKMQRKRKNIDVKCSKQTVIKNKSVSEHIDETKDTTEYLDVPNKKKLKLIKKDNVINFNIEDCNSSHKKPDNKKSKESEKKTKKSKKHKPIEFTEGAAVDCIHSKQSKESLKNKRYKNL